MKLAIKPLLIGAASLLLAGVASWPAFSLRQSEAPAPAAGFSVEQVTLLTADGARLDGVSYRPTTRQRSSAILLVHGFGSNFYSEYFPQFARAAAELGYVSLALNMRDHDTGPKVSDFAGNEADIAAGLGYLRKLGHTSFVLLGQSMGTNRVLYYLAVTGDPTIAATALVSGPGNLFEWNVWQFSQKKAQAIVDEALELQAAGHEQQLMLIDLGPLGKSLYTARYLLSLRGPKARSDPYQNIQKVISPLLIIQGTADKLIAPDIATRLKKDATSSRKVDLIYIDGADHSFRKQEGVLAQRVLAWLKEVAP